MATTRTRTVRNSFTSTRGFGFKSAPVFTCDTCSRRTRHNGTQSVGSKLCPQCYELAGIENEISDGYCTLAERRVAIDRYFAEIEAKGGTPRENFSALVSDGGAL